MKERMKKTLSGNVKGSCCTSVDTPYTNKNLSVAPNNEEKEKILTCGDCADFPCDDSEAHLKTDKECDWFKPNDNSKMDLNRLKEINVTNLKDSIRDIAKSVVQEIGKEEEEDKVCVIDKYTREETVLNTSKLAKVLIDKYNIVSYGNVRDIKSCMPYVYKDGFYQIGEITLNNDISVYAADYKAVNSIRKETLDTLHFIRSLTATDKNPFNKYPYAINVNNGVLVFDRLTGSYELKEHSPEYMFNYKLPINYNPDAPDTLHEVCFKKWIDEPETLYQIAAQGIIQSMNDAPFKKAYLIQGERNAGKSTFLLLLYKLFSGYVSNVPLQSLSDRVSRFNISNLEGKMFNISDDLSDIPMEDVGTFKNLTGSYTQNIEYKQRGGYTGRINAVHVYTCNVPPEFNKKIKKDTAFWCRWNLIRFCNYFNTDDKFTDIYTEDNMSGFFNHVLDMICKIFLNDGLIYNSDASEIREQWSLSTDVIHQFIEDNIEIGNGEMCVNPEELLETIKRYVLSNDLDLEKVPTSIRLLSDALDKFDIYYERVTSEIGKPYVYIIPGVWSIGAKFICSTVKRKTRQVSMSVSAN